MYRSAILACVHISALFEMKLQPVAFSSNLSSAICSLDLLFLHCVLLVWTSLL